MPDLTRRQIALILSVVLAAATFVVGIYGLVAGPQQRADSASPPSGRSVEAGRSATKVHRSPDPISLPQTTDPLVYARSVAMLLFTWDTTAGLMPADVSAPVLADADPSGQETAGLLTDLGLYLPTDDQWLDLAQLEVRQQLSITSAQVPQDWASIVANSHGQLSPGNEAVTISGTRERTGVWHDEPASSSYEVAFTVFMACPPIFDRCRVLRLSQLNNPLR